MKCTTCGAEMDKELPGRCTNPDCLTRLKGKFGNPNRVDHGAKGLTLEGMAKAAGYDVKTSPEWRTAIALERIASSLEKMQPIVERLAMAWAGRPRGGGGGQKAKQTDDTSDS